MVSSRDQTELFRIVHERDGKRVEIPLGPGDDEWAVRMLAWHRSVAPDGLEVYLERQDISPRPWERLSA